MKLFFYFVVVCSLAAASFACNSTSNDRFNNQQDSYVFETTSSKLSAYGASSIDGDDSTGFRCPAVSGMSSESNVTVFHARANANYPHFTLRTISGIRGDSQGGFGISMMDLPVGLLDIYQRCGIVSQEKLTTFCPPGYAIVDDCSSVASGENACALIYEGSHRLVVSATMNDAVSCFSEEIDRTPYSSQSTPYPAYACDAFSPIPLPAAYRGTAPSNDCCSVEDYSTLDFCLKPCGCRELTVQIMAKTELDPVTDAPALDTNDYSDELRIAVFSNVEGNDDAFLDMLDSIYDKNVDAAVSLGNLTFNGNGKAFAEKRLFIDSAFTSFDGISATSKCTIENDFICCPGSEERVFSGTCNAILEKVAFLAGLGENEYEGDVSAFNEAFGPSYSSTFVGKVQLIMLDTSDATLSGAQEDWLKELLKTPEATTCNIPAPEDGDHWPTLAECHQKQSSSKTATCRECIGHEAYCIPPDSEHSDAMLGPENCVCVPASSKICLNNLTCKETNGTDSECVCSRDVDCGTGGTCVDGICKPPVRLVFSYTPLFDEFGSRNNALSSKNDAARLLALLGKSNVAAVFSGRVRDYASYSKAGIPMYITGGGGGEMTSFARKGHHWLLVTIPNAYTNPDPDKISVETIEF